MAPASKASFEPARDILRRAALRTTFAPRGLARILVWGLLTGGGFFVLLGLGADALWGQGSGPGTWSLVAFAFYVVIAGFFLFHSRGPVVISGTPYFPRHVFDRFMLGCHAASMLGMILFSHSFGWTIAFEAAWLLLWLAALVAMMWGAAKPVALGLWFIGSVCYCNERDMVLETVASWDWWDQFPVGEKKALWDALPDWKWDLYGHAVRQKNDGVTNNLVEWMQLESDPYWHVVCSMHDHDMPTSIRAFLQTKNGSSELESYALPL